MRALAPAGLSSADFLSIMAFFRSLLRREGGRAGELRPFPTRFENSLEGSLPLRAGRDWNCRDAAAEAARSGGAGGFSGVDQVAQFL